VRGEPIDHFRAGAVLSIFLYDLFEQVARHYQPRSQGPQALADDGEGYHGTYNQGPYRPSCCLND
jgi:hypothetical protein